VRVPIDITVNGVEQRAGVEPRTLLVQFLRDHLGLTGAHIGCETSQCGACTVLLDGRRVLSCLVLAVARDGAEVTTADGLAADGALHPVQQAFLDAEAFQCGYCTSGMVMATVGLLKTNPNPTEPDIARLMDRNVCRCGTYPRIVKAVRMAAERMRTTSSAIGGK